MMIWVGASSRAWQLMLIGVVGVSVGIFTLIYPGATAVALLYIIVAWGVVRGAGDLITAYLLRKDLKNVSEFVNTGLASILFGVWLLVIPARGALVMLWLIGGYAVDFGVALIAGGGCVHTVSATGVFDRGPERGRLAAVRVGCKLGAVAPQVEQSRHTRDQPQRSRLKVEAGDSANAKGGEAEDERSEGERIGDAGRA